MTTEKQINDLRTSAWLMLFVYVAAALGTCVGLSCAVSVLNTQQTDFVLRHNEHVRELQQLAPTEENMARVVARCRNMGINGIERLIRSSKIMVHCELATIMLCIAGMMLPLRVLRLSRTTERKDEAVKDDERLSTCGAVAGGEEEQSVPGKLRRACRRAALGYFAMFVFVVVLLGWPFAVFSRMTDMGRLGWSLCIGINWLSVVVIGGPAYLMGLPVEKSMMAMAFGTSIQPWPLLALAVWPDSAQSRRFRIWAYAYGAVYIVIGLAMGHRAYLQ